MTPAVQTETTHQPIYQVAYGTFFVESSDGLKLYKVHVDGDTFCSCPDYARHASSDPAYQCKHIQAVMQADGTKTFTLQPAQSTKPKLDEHFIKNIQGKEYVLFAGLLDLGHQKGILKLEVEAVQYPVKDNGYEAITKAVLVARDGSVYTDIGDANPKNCNSMIAQHVLRMASTRAKARVLRDFTNVGMTALEELGELSDVIGDTKESSKPAKSRKTANPPKPDTKQAPTPPQTAVKPGMSDAQKRAVNNLAQRRGISEEQLAQLSREKYGADLATLSSSDAANFIRYLQQVS